MCPYRRLQIAQQTFHRRCLVLPSTETSHDEVREANRRRRRQRCSPHCTTRHCLSIWLRLGPGQISHAPPWQPYTYSLWSRGRRKPPPSWISRLQHAVSRCASVRANQMSRARIAATSDDPKKTWLHALTPAHMLSCLPCSATAVPWQEQRGLHRTRLLKACWTLWCRHEEAAYYRPTSQVSCLVQAVRAGCLADLLALQRVRRRGECSQQCSQREPCSHGLAPWFVVW